MQDLLHGQQLDDPPRSVVEGSALEGHMEIFDLRPKSVFTSKEKTISRRYAPNGVIINATRYVAAIVSGDSNGLFARRVRQKPGGTVLIDASGSMGASRENLRKLCELIPTATVAYYSGTDRNGKGILTIYAYKGKRYAGELPARTLQGGNSVGDAVVRRGRQHRQGRHRRVPAGSCAVADPEDRRCR